MPTPGENFGTISTAMGGEPKVFISLSIGKTVVDLSKGPYVNKPPSVIVGTLLDTSSIHLSSSDSTAKLVTTKVVEEATSAVDLLKTGTSVPVSPGLTITANLPTIDNYTLKENTEKTKGKNTNSSTGQPKGKKRFGFCIYPHHTINTSITRSYLYVPLLYLSNELDLARDRKFPI